MDRNMFRRVEICFPLENPVLRQQVIADLQWYIKDNCQAWLLNADGNYQPATPGMGEAPFSAQTALLNAYTEDATRITDKPETASLA